MCVKSLPNPAWLFLGNVVSNMVLHHAVCLVVYMAAPMIPLVGNWMLLAECISLLNLTITPKWLARWRLGCILGVRMPLWIMTHRMMQQDCPVPYPLAIVICDYGQYAFMLYDAVLVVRILAIMVRRETDTA